jgi:stage II sporulation protein D
MTDIPTPHPAETDPAEATPSAASETPSTPSGYRRYLTWSHHHWKALASLGFLVALIAAVLATSCDWRWWDSDSELRQQPVTQDGVPVMRVRLERGLSQATIAAGRGYLLQLNGRAVRASDTQAMAPCQLTRRGGRWIVDGRQIGDGDLKLIAPADRAVVINEKAYRGFLLFLPRDESTFDVINYVDMESYLAGVLSCELYPSWDLETYHALAIAARSFALYHRNSFGRTHDYDVGDGTASQVYGGVDGETDRAWQAVRDTHGQVLAYVAPGQEPDFFMPQYSAACGGVVNGSDVIRPAEDIPPLRGGQRCTDCEPCPRYTWPTVTVSKQVIYEAIVEAYPDRAPRLLGDGVDTIWLSRTPYGRIHWVKIIGTRRAEDNFLRIRGEDLRLYLMRAGVSDLYSMNCDIRDDGPTMSFINGRGFGHGVGMCQWGAQGKASQGWSGRQILEFYYPRSSVIRAY